MSIARDPNDVNHAGSQPPAPTEPPVAAARSWWPQLRRSNPQTQRYLGLDAARGLAIVGMVIAHAVVIPEWGHDPAAWLGVVNGRSSILFATIAGVSLTLISGGTTPPTGVPLLRTRLSIVGRAVMLLIFAGILSLFRTNISLILASYAVWFMLAIPMLSWRPRRLLVTAAMTGVLGPMLVVLARIAFQEWGATTGDSNAFLLVSFFESMYPTAIWMSFVLAGMALGRCGLNNTQALKRFLVGGFVLFALVTTPFVISAGSPAPLLSNLSSSKISGEKMPLPEELEGLDTGELGLCVDFTTETILPCPIADSEAQLASFTQEQWDIYTGLVNEYLSQHAQQAAWWQALVTVSPHSGSPFEVISSGALALVLIAGFVLLGRYVGSRWALLPLISPGSMALTVYCAHVVALSLLPPTEFGDLVGWLLLAGLIVVSLGWSALWRSGPLEQLTGAVSDRMAGRPPRSIHSLAD